MRGETVCVGGIQTWRRKRAVDAEIVLVLVDGLGHGLERLVILDVVGALDHRVILAGVIVDDLLVVDDAVPFSRVWQRERIAINGVGVGLAVIGEQFVRFGVLQWLAILLIFCELVETGDVEHGRRVGLGQLRAHGRIVCAGRTGLHVHLHTGFSVYISASCLYWSTTSDLLFMKYTWPLSESALLPPQAANDTPMANAAATAHVLVMIPASLLISFVGFVVIRWTC